jgi:hypothetical protein
MKDKAFKKAGKVLEFLNLHEKYVPLPIEEVFTDARDRFSMKYVNVVKKNHYDTKTFRIKNDRVMPAFLVQYPIQMVEQENHVGEKKTLKFKKLPKDALEIKEIPKEL